MGKYDKNYTSNLDAEVRIRALRNIPPDSFIDGDNVVSNDKFLTCPLEWFDPEYTPPPIQHTVFDKGQLANIAAFGDNPSWADW